MSREIYDVMKDMKDVFAAFESGDVKNVDWEKFKPFYTCMANEIKYQHERVGGHFVVANAVTSREMRDHIRKTIPNCIFVTLTLTKETQRKRVTERHGEEGADAIIDFLTKMYQLYEGPGEGEENTFNVDITENMTREDVKQKVLEVLRPWKDGFYHNANNLGMLTKVKGNQCMWHNYLVMDYPESDPMATGTWEYGDFGPAKEEVVKASGGIKNYNMQLQMSVMMKNNAILTPDKSKVLFWGMTGSVNTLQWMSDEALKKICDEREDFREPSCPYKMQPENVGKLVWLSGPPGAGKSTTGQWMARDSGYVYYEADCTLSCLNPYVPTDVDNPTLAAFRQKPLKVIDVATLLTT